MANGKWQMLAPKGIRVRVPLELMNAVFHRLSARSQAAEPSGPGTDSTPRSGPRRPGLGLIWVMIGLVWAWRATAALDLVPVPELGLRVARGFQVSLFADSQFANDIHAMTLDAQGRVVVTGPGYIKTLLDEDEDGQAEAAVLFAPVRQGQGLCFEGTSLYFVGDDGLYKFTDADGDGVADGPGEAILPLGTAEAGAHALRKGPDGWWYLIGGNETGFEARHNTAPFPLVPMVEAGALLRLSPDASQAEVIAHGFRGPWGFDFNLIGDVLTLDGDAPSEYPLPWYAPPRVMHVAPGGHHGWRGRGRLGLWPRPDYYADAVATAGTVDRGVPAGVACYRHVQFPLYFRGGFFMLDWELGRVLFVGSQPVGSTYECQEEVFVEPLGTHGFTPTAVVVAADGALWIATGGRKTAGAVYRIEYVGADSPPVLPVTPNPELDFVLQAPQPLEAWSRAIWQPRALQLGVEAFQPVIADDSLDSAGRIRAIEIVTELFGGLTAIRAQAGARSADPLVRARVAWSLGRVPPDNAAALLFDLAADAEPLVRRCALEAMLDQPELVDGPPLIRVLLLNLGDSDKRLRQLAARVASRLPDVTWQGLEVSLERAAPALRLNGLLARLWREEQAMAHPEVVRAALEILSRVNAPQLSLDALRLVMLGLGDWNLLRPAEDLYASYELGFAPPLQDPESERIRQVIRPLVWRANPPVDTEAARLLAMLGEDDARVSQAVLNLITNRTSATADFHFLTCLTRFRAQPPALAPKIADALLDLDRKLSGQESNPRLSWNARLAEVAAKLWARDPRITEAMLRHPRFASAGHVPLALGLQGAQRAVAAERFLAATRGAARLRWTPELVDLLSALPAEQVRPVLRQQWANVGLRDQILLKLAAWPEGVDRAKYLEGLRSRNLTVVRASLGALLQLPRENAPASYPAPLSLLRRLLSEPSAQDLRPQVVRLLSTMCGQPFLVTEQEATPASLRRSYQPLFDWFGQKYPEAIRALNREETEDPIRWMTFLKEIVWAKGQAVRGERLFAERGCLACHAEPAPLGPPMTRLAERLAPENLLMAVVFPSREIAAPYQPTQFCTRDGRFHLGLVVFESPDVILLQAAAANTERLWTADLAWERPSEVSIMPAGLLKGLKPSDLADLYAFLKALQAGPQN